MDKKLKIILYCIVILFNHIYGQQNTDKIKSERFIKSGLSLQYINLHNPQQSNVLYNGLAYTIDLGLRFEKPTIQHGVYLLFLKGALTSQNKLNTNNIFNISLGYYLEKRIKQISESINWYLGGDINTFLNLRTNIALSNNQVFYDFVQNLRISTSLLNELNWKDRPLYLDYQLKIPFIAIISRPPKAIYVKDTETKEGLPTSSQITGTMFTNGKIVFAGKYSTIQSAITIRRPFRKNNNITSISYIWDLYTYNDYFNQNQVIGTHSIKLLLLVNY